jgi:uncharacterized membrane protein YfcA
MGSVVGLLTAIFGVGGGFLLVPALTAFIGLPFDVATTLSLCFIIGASLNGLYFKIKLGDFDKKALLYTLPTALIGVICGDIIKDLIKSHFSEDIAIFNHTMMLVFAVFLIFIASITLHDVFKKTSSHAALFFRIKPLVRLSSPIPPVSLISLLLGGLAVGILSGLLGVGGGLIFLPLLVAGMKLPLNIASGTSLGLVFITALIGITKKGLPDDLHFSLIMLFLLLSGSFIGIKAGITFSKKQKDTTLKILLAAILLMVAISILISELYLI